MDAGAGRHGVVKLLLSETAAKVDAVDIDGSTALHLAMYAPL